MAVGNADHRVLSHVIELHDPSVQVHNPSATVELPAPVALPTYVHIPHRPDNRAGVLTRDRHACTAPQRGFSGAAHGRRV